MKKFGSTVYRPRFHEIVRCTFNDPDGTSLDSYSWGDADDLRIGSNQWVEQRGDWEIRGAGPRALPPAPSPSPRWTATIDCGTSNYKASIESVDADAYTCIAFRFVNWQQFWMFGILGGEIDTYWLAHNDYAWPPVPSLTGDLAQPVQAGDLIEVIVSGGNLEVRVAGITYEECNLTNVGNTSSTLVGIYTNSDVPASLQLDNFVVSAFV